MILVIDDEPILLNTSRSLLKQAFGQVLGKDNAAKIKILTAKNFGEAIAIASQETLLVFSDHDLGGDPGTDGSDILRHLKENSLISANCLLIGCSVRLDVNQDKFITAGADGVVPKVKVDADGSIKGMKTEDILAVLQNIALGKPGPHQHTENPLKMFLENIFQNELSGPTPVSTPSLTPVSTPQLSSPSSTFPSVLASPLQAGNLSLLSLSRSPSLYSLSDASREPIQGRVAEQVGSTTAADLVDEADGEEQEIPAPQSRLT
jgi:CheY-like chemotaxis protein